MRNRKLLIGIDIGGTNSDLVVIEPNRLEEQDRGVITWHEEVTTPNVSVGIENSIRTVLDDTTHRILKEEIISITIGTTHLINAVIERDESKLEKVAVLRSSGPHGKDLPPFGEKVAAVKSAKRRVEMDENEWKRGRNKTGRRVDEMIREIYVRDGD